MTCNLSKTLVAGVASLGLIALAGPAAAHHSHSMFDLTSEKTVTGTVKTFVFTNPHVFLYLNVPESEGKVTTYAIEMSHVQNMISRGITAASFKPGDPVTIKMNPLHDGRPGGNYVSVIKDGREFGKGAAE
jgi:Family of unknown function (DUF6152)